MSNRSKTYHIFSTLTLILFLSSIVLPSGISAASLFCDMEMAAMHGMEESCCIHLNIDDINSHSVTKVSKDCSFQKICAHILSDSQLNVQAVQQITKEILIVVLAEKLYPLSKEKQRHIQLNYEQPVAKKSPPIFLLNSSFLN